MKFLNQIKTALGERRLHKRKDERVEARVANFDRARSVAVVYREKGESFFILVKQYVKYLKAEVGIREVMAMAYVEDASKVPHYQTHRLRYDYFTGKELDFFMEPGCDQVSNFVSNDFDILIDLERDPPLPLRFITQSSKAHFKVGYYSESNEHMYDMMIKVSPQAAFDEYIKQVNHYLNLIDTYNARA